MTLDFPTYTSFVKEFGSRLRKLREEAGLTQRDLARLAKIEQMQISRYERGVGYPSVETLLALARTLDVDLTYFLLGTKPEAPARQAEAFRHLLLFEKLREADRELTGKDVDMVVALVDAFLVRKRMKRLVNE